MYVDTCNRLSFVWSGSIWHCQNNIISETAPQITITASGVISSNSKISWYNSTTGQWYDAINGAWRGRASLIIDSLLARNNTWTGKNTFSDSLTAQKGIKSGGLIDTKGLNTEGSASTAAATLKGVQADKDTVVTTNFSLDGRYGTVGFDCTSGAKNCTFPTTSGTTDWRFIIRKDDNSTNDLIVKTSSGTEFYRVKSKMTVIFKNINGTFKRIQ